MLPARSKKPPRWLRGKKPIRMPRRKPNNWRCSKKADADAAMAKAQQEAQAAEQARLQAEHDAALKRDEEARQTALSEAARKQEAACNDEQDRLTWLQAAGKKAKDDLTAAGAGAYLRAASPASDCGP